jgi:hypothetical protein
MEYFVKHRKIYAFLLRDSTKVQEDAPVWFSDAVGRGEVILKQVNDSILILTPFPYNKNIVAYANRYYVIYDPSGEGYKLTSMEKEEFEDKFTCFDDVLKPKGTKQLTEIPNNLSKDMNYLYHLQMENRDLKDILVEKENLPVAIGRLIELNENEMRILKYSLLRRLSEEHF